jgi:flagellin-specific chaperone FliS
MDLTLSIILVVCVIIMTLLSIYLTIITSLILFRIKSTMDQIERFSKLISDLSSGWAKIIPGVLSFLVDLRTKRKKKKGEG